MNFCRELQTTSEILQIFFGRSQLLPQHCPVALHLGFKFIARYIHHHPMFPFTVNERGFPFKEEGEAKQFLERGIESACENLRAFEQNCSDDRERRISQMVTEDGEANCSLPTMHFCFGTFLIYTSPSKCI